MTRPTLVEFLLTRVAEDEKLAAAFKGTAYAGWHLEPDPDPGRIGGRVVAGLGGQAIVANDWSSPYNPAGYIGVSGHIARWEPGHVLAECAAKRLIIGQHGWMGPVMAGLPVDDPKSCVTCADHEQPGSPSLPWPCATIRALVLPYANHAEYRPEWRP